MGKNDRIDRINEIEQHLVEFRNLFTQLFKKMVKRSSKTVGIPFNPSQMRALSAFHEDREYRMGELSKNANVTMPFMTEMVDGLVQAELLDRLRDTEDRRVVKVKLSEKGKKIHKQFVKIRANEMSSIFAKLDNKDQAALLQALRKMSAILKKI
ncbi:MAG: MarR family transcriptional regulator [Proteobacteria bacterium]|nr:MarR family transcriptional regulator [Pseudomonadota bacterium]